jgi:hypothetical protein
MGEPEGETLPAYYALGPGGWRDVWTLLHPPYTAWHLSYVVIGACLAPRLSADRLAATLIAFFLAVGIAAHALDELHGRPLRTSIPSRALVVAAALGLGGAVVLGALGVTQIGWALVPFIGVGAFLVLAYNLEWFGGFVHTDAGFAAAWGSFPVLTAYVAQASELSVTAVLSAAVAFGLTSAQRSLSNRARLIRRRATAATGELTLRDGSKTIDKQWLLQPIEQALRALSWSAIALAATLLVFRYV